MEHLRAEQAGSEKRATAAHRLATLDLADQLERSVKSIFESASTAPTETNAITEAVRRPQPLIPAQDSAIAAGEFANFL